jgi:DNA-directed RNA polymerase subunit RPC12/RpoP
MSTIEFTCSNCEKSFRVRSEFAGKSTHCPSCSQRVQIAGTARPVDIWKVEPPTRQDPAPTQARLGEMSLHDREAMLRSVKLEQTGLWLLGITILVVLIAWMIWNMSPQNIFINSTPFLAFLLMFSCFLFYLLRARRAALHVAASDPVKSVARASLFCLIPGLIAFMIVDMSILYEWLCTQLDMLRYARQYWGLEYYWFWDFFTWFSTSAAFFSFWMWIVQANTILQSELISQRSAKLMEGVGFYFLASILLLVAGRYAYQIDSSTHVGDGLVIVTLVWVGLLMAVFLPLYWKLLKQTRRVLEGMEGY